MEGCRIWYDHAEIPFTNAAAHATSNGGSFIIEPVRHAAAASSSASANPSRMQSEEGVDLTTNDVPATHDMDVNATGLMDYVDPDQGEPDLPSPDSPSSQDSRSFQAVHIYSLGRPHLFGHVDGSSYHMALRDMAQLAQVPLRQVVCFHYAQVRLQGHSDAEEAVILQHTVDIRQGSPEKLVIVDLELHSNRLQQGLPYLKPRVLFTNCSLLWLADISSFQPTLHRIARGWLINALFTTTMWNGPEMIISDKSSTGPTSELFFHRHRDQNGRLGKQYTCG